ncbi:SpoIIE family protein phosphatase [Mycolicibacterium sp. 3033]|nr:SpoIIE family protein phosphatase [Mycolicibacterium aurantiacum]
MLILVCAVAYVSLVTRPAALTTAAWWPNAGLALGLGIRYRRRYAVPLAAAVTVVTVPVVVAAGRPFELALVLTVASGIEMVLGILLLRGRQDTSPQLCSPTHLRKFLVVAAGISVLYALLAAGGASLVGDRDGAWDRLLTSGPRHAAGILLLTPLFMAMSRPRLRQRLSGSLVCVGATFGVTVVVFWLNSGLPLAFLPFLPLTWAAMRLSTRTLILVMLGVALIASFGSSHGSGPFSFDRLGAPTGTTVLQIFEASMVVVFLALSVVVGSERETAAQLHDSDELFRKSFDSSVAGKLMVRRTPSEWVVERSNQAACELFPEIEVHKTTLDQLLGDSATAEIAQDQQLHDAGSARLIVNSSDGRTLAVSLALITDRPDGSVYIAHFHDVTEAQRARRLDREELQRAADVQRALQPATSPTTPGWDYGMASTPARQVGGDFYDVRIHEPQVVISLGDVMGKGTGAGMLAAATRTALRSQDPGAGPSAGVAAAADLLDSDLDRAGAFVTLAHVHVDLNTGDFRFVDAGHGLHFVIRADSGRVERITSQDMPLGPGTQWNEGSGRLEPGDAMLLVSDGVLELWGGSLEQLHTAIEQCCQQHGGDVQVGVEALCTKAWSSPDEDDATAVALRRHPREAGGTYPESAVSQPG